MSTLNVVSVKPTIDFSEPRLSVQELKAEGESRSRSFIFQFYLGSNSSAPELPYLIKLRSNSKARRTVDSSVWKVAEAVGVFIESTRSAGNQLKLEAVAATIRDSFDSLLNNQEEGPGHEAILGLKKQFEAGLSKDFSATKRCDWLKIIPRVVASRSWPRVDHEQVDAPAPNVFGPSDGSNRGGVDLDSHLMERASLVWGLGSVRYGTSAFMAKDREGRTAPFNYSGSAMTGEVARRIVNDKEATRALLESASVPVPRGRTFPVAAVREAAEYASFLGWPVVVKPVNGRHGTAVTLGVDSPDMLETAFRAVREAPGPYSSAIVEEQIEGGNYRIFAVDGRVVSAVLARHGSVTGTGIHSIAELILDKVALRATNPHLRSRRIEVTDQTVQRLAQQDLTLDSILAKNVHAEFTPKILFRGGGESVEVLDEMHPSIIRAAERALRLMPQLGYTGLDFLIPDHRRALSDQRAAICEINAHPNLGSGVYPLYGTPRDVPGEFLKYVARQTGMRTSARAAATMSLHVRVTGGGIEQSRIERFVQSAKNRGIDGWISAGIEEAELVVSGTSEAVTSLANSLYKGLGEAKKRVVETAHTPPPGPGFHIINGEEAEAL